MYLDKNLDLLIRAKGITVSRIARATNIPIQTIHNWLNGCSPANLEYLKQVADFFEVTIDELCFSKTIDQVPNRFNEYQEEINAGIYEVILRKK